MASMIDILPREVIEHIIDFLASDDHRETEYRSTYMKACSLTCWTFFPRSRENLFHSIKLHDRYKESNKPFALAHVFVRLITERPQIASYVRRLDYVMKNTLLGNLTPVPSELNLLTNLETLVLQPELGRFQWHGINSVSRRVLLDLMHLPTINTLKLISIQSLVLSDLVLCPNLKNLHLQHVSIGDESAEPPMSQPTSIQLHTLELSYSSIHATLQIMERKCADGRPLIDLSELKDLSVFVSDLEDALWAGEIFSHVLHLETARLIVSETYHAADLDMLLSTSLKTLVNLNIDIFSNGTGVQSLGGVVRALQGMAGRNHIRVLKLRVKMVRRVTHKVGDEWGLLERVLLAPGWSFLKQVYISVFTTPEDSWQQNDIKKLAETRLIGLSSTNSLAFSFLVGKGNQLTSRMSAFPPL